MAGAQAREINSSALGICLANWRNLLRRRSNSHMSGKTARIKPMGSAMLACMPANTGMNMPTTAMMAEMPKNWVGVSVVSA